MSGSMKDFRKPGQTTRVKILGAPEALNPDAVQILDTKTTAPQPQMTEVVIHEEILTLDDKLRAKPLEPGEPEVRVRQNDGTFDKVKRGDD